MEHKIILFNIDDIAIDPDDVCDSLNEACTKRQRNFRVRGVCQLEDRVYFIVVPLKPGEEPEEYVISSIDDISHDGFSTLLQNRYQGGFDMVGTFKVYETYMALFAKPA